MEKSYKSGKNSAIQDCKFPFRQNGLEYKGCAPSFEKGKGPHCATEVDENNNLKKLARCNEFCKLDSGIWTLHRDELTIYIL